MTFVPNQRHTVGWLALKPPLILLNDKRRDVGIPPYNDKSEQHAKRSPEQSRERVFL